MDKESINGVVKKGVATKADFQKVNLVGGES
jgi:hypothetical protein